MPAQFINCTYGSMGHIDCFTTSTTSNPSNGGTTSGDGACSDGSSVTIGASCTPGFQFDYWSEADTMVSTNILYSFILENNRVFVAEFSTDTLCSVATIANPPEGGSTTGDGTYTSGDPVTVNAYANDFYQFISWTEADSTVSTDSSYSFNIYYDRNLVANFSLVEYTVTTAVLPPGAGTTSGDGSYPVNSYIGVMATPNEGFQFTMDRSRYHCIHFQHIYFYYY